MGSALTIERASFLLAKLNLVMVRFSGKKDASQHLMPARLLSVVDRNTVEIKPYGHGRPEHVEISNVQEWYSRNNFLAAQCGVCIDAVDSSGKLPPKPNNDVKYVIVSESRKAVYLGQGRWSSNPTHGQKFKLEEVLQVFEGLLEKEDPQTLDGLQYATLDDAVKIIGNLIEPVKSHIVSAVSTKTEITKPAPARELVISSVFVPTQFPVNAGFQTRMETVKKRLNSGIGRFQKLQQELAHYRAEIAGCSEELGALINESCEGLTTETKKPHTVHLSEGRQKTLDIVLKYGKIDVKTLSKKLGSSVYSVYSTVDKLCEGGLVQKVPTTKRSFYLCATDLGKSVANRTK